MTQTKDAITKRIEELEFRLMETRSFIFTLLPLGMACIMLVLAFMFPIFIWLGLILFVGSLIQFRNHIKLKKELKQRLGVK